jgi:hypothetical protein
VTEPMPLPIVNGSPVQLPVFDTVAEGTPVGAPPIPGVPMAVMDDAGHVTMEEVNDGSGISG